MSVVENKFFILFILAWVLGSCSSKPDGQSTSDEVEWKSPQEELAAFDVAEGFEANVFASEPDVINPIAIQFDPSGRLWVVSSPDYPQILPGEDHKGKIIILEDTNGDGVSDKSTVFADDLFLPNGLALGDGGVYVASGTEVLHLKDTSGDGKADKRRVVMSGFGAGDSHTNLNNLQWSKDGSLFMSQGFHSHHSRILTPYGLTELHRDGHWRWRPRTGRLDAFLGDHTAWSNPWGTTFDKWGQPFFISGGGGEINWLKPGMTASKGHATLPSRWPSEERRERSNLCGFEYIGGDHFPESMQGAMLGGGFLTGYHDIPIFTLSDDGAGYSVDMIEPALVKSSSRTFRPCDIKQGPDGAIYIADFTQYIIGHYEYSLRDPRRDYTRGRIWRIAPTEKPLPERKDFSQLSNEALLDALHSNTPYERYQARRVLSERNREQVIGEVIQWIAELNKNHPDYAYLMVQAMGILADHEHIDVALMEDALKLSDPKARGFATSLIALWHDRLEGVETLLLTLADDDHPQVRLEAIVAATFVDVSLAMDVVEKVQRHPRDSFIDYAIQQVEKARRDLMGIETDEILTEERPLKELLVERGENIFYMCAACHGQEGEGITGDGSTLIGSSWVVGDPDHLIRIVLNGFQRTRGENDEFPAGVMPPHAYLSNDQVAAILTYIRQLPGNNANAILPEHVDLIREETAGRNRIWTSEELHNLDN